MLTKAQIHSLRQWAEGIRDETVVCPAPTMAKTVLKILDYVDMLEVESQANADTAMQWKQLWVEQRNRADDFEERILQFMNKDLT